MAIADWITGRANIGQLFKGLVNRHSENTKQSDDASVGTSLGVVMASVDLSHLKDVGFYVLNNSATALNAFQLEVSPDGTNWVVVDNSTLATLGNTIGRITVADNPGGYYRCQASVAAGSTTLDIWTVGG